MDNLITGDLRNIEALFKLKQFGFRPRTQNHIRPGLRKKLRNPLPDPTAGTNHKTSLPFKIHIKKPPTKDGFR